MVSARLSEETVKAVDRWGAANGATRSEAIRRLVELGLGKAAPGSAKVRR
jgi:Ribbon-helix-helix protein, copG family